MLLASRTKKQPTKKQHNKHGYMHIYVYIYIYMQNTVFTSYSAPNYRMPCRKCAEQGLRFSSLILNGYHQLTELWVGINQLGHKKRNNKPGGFPNGIPTPWPSPPPPPQKKRASISLSLLLKLKDNENWADSGHGRSSAVRTQAVEPFTFFWPPVCPNMGSPCVSLSKQTRNKKRPRKTYQSQKHKQCHRT